MSDRERLMQIADAFEDTQRRAEAQRVERKAAGISFLKSEVLDAPLSIQLRDGSTVVVEWRDLAALFRSAALNTEAASAK